MSRLYSTECDHCELTEPDRNGNQDLIFDPACPVHGYDERAVIGDAELFTGSPRDACKDRCAELVDDGVYLTSADVLCANHLARRRDQVGLPATGDLPPARATTPGPRPATPHGARAEGVTDEQQPRRSRAEAA